MRFSIAGGSSFSATNRDWTAGGRRVADACTAAPPPPPPPAPAMLPPITHPRSHTLADSLSGDVFGAIASLADHGSHTGAGAKLSRVSRRCKELVEMDRLLFLAERAYACAFLELAPTFGPTNKRDLLVGAPSASALGVRVRRLREAWPRAERGVVRDSQVGE